MKLTEILSEKVADTAGKLGIVTGTVTATGEKAGLLENVGLVQFVSMCGVVWLMLERTQKALITAYEKGRVPFILSCVAWGFAWFVFSFCVWTLI